MIITLQWYLNCFLWYIYCCFDNFLLFGMQNVEKIEDFIIHFLLLTIKVDQVSWIYLLFSSCDYNEFQFLIVLYLHSCSKRRFFLLISWKSSDVLSGKVCTIYKPNYKWEKKKKKKQLIFNVGVWEDDEFKNKEENLMDFGLCISIAYTIRVQPICLGQFC